MERSVLFVDRNKIKKWSSTVIREFIDLSFKALLFRMVLFRIFIPIEGRHHDAGMLMESNVLAQMANHMVIYFLFMVTLHTHLVMVTSYRGGAISRNQMIFNKRMSAVRICVEWAFGKVLSLFAYLDLYYAVAVLLTNCHTCMYGSETSSFFNLQPPALLEYLRG